MQQQAVEEQFNFGFSWLRQMKSPSMDDSLLESTRPVMGTLLARLHLDHLLHVPFFHLSGVTHHTCVAPQPLLLRPRRTHETSWTR